MTSVRRCSRDGNPAPSITHRKSGAQTQSLTSFMYVCWEACKEPQIAKNVTSSQQFEQPTNPGHYLCGYDTSFTSSIAQTHFHNFRPDRCTTDSLNACGQRHRLYIPVCIQTRNFYERNTVCMQDFHFLGGPGVVPSLQLPLLWNSSCAMVSSSPLCDESHF